ncbi:MAG: H-type small acid-soluble spore protein [Syntrophomonadaceae bacterium]|jgi:H-type small acid-soluble spore protein|nr:H-type small acid-soluble spore protein [Syntrophomonadaceae bacterium]
MDVQRAHDIVNSLGVIEVFYQGEPVWIEDIVGDKARVEFLNRRHKAEVPVRELVEGL